MVLLVGIPEKVIGRPFGRNSPQNLGSTDISFRSTIDTTHRKAHSKTSSGVRVEVAWVLNYLSQYDRSRDIRRGCVTRIDIGENNRIASSRRKVIVT